MTVPTPETLASAALQRHATMIAAGVAGVSTLALLAAGSLAPLLTGGMTTAAVTAWLGNLGGNALANWLNKWAHANLTRASGDDWDAEQRLVAALARDLQAQPAVDALAVDVAALLVYTQAIPTVFDALQGQGGQQIRLLSMLLADLQSATFRNEQLHDVTLRAVVEQGEALRDVIERYDATLLAEIRAQQPGDTVQGDQVGGDKITTRGGEISIGGNVGTMQSITITGGTMQGSIIGSQTNFYGAPLPAGLGDQPESAVSQEDIDEQRELLEAYRRTLAIYLKRLAKLGEAHAPPEVIHGIREARAGIQHVKATLRQWGVSFADHPDDEQTA